MHARSLTAAFATLVLAQAASHGQDVVVQSAAAREKSAPASSFLTRPGTGGTAYSSASPRSVSFFGSRAEGTFFVFVVDRSGSMADAGRWLRVRSEMQRTLQSLQFPQRYLVIFYNDEASTMPGGIPASAGHATTNRTLSWMRSVVPEGPTDPREAMRMALGWKPSAVFLLTDGEFPAGTADAIASYNRADTPIHCIDLAGGSGRPALEQIARDSGGEYSSPVD